MSLPIEDIIDDVIAGVKDLLNPVIWVVDSVAARVLDLWDWIDLRLGYGPMGLLGWLDWEFDKVLHAISDASNINVDSIVKSIKDVSDTTEDTYDWLTISLRGQVNRIGDGVEDLLASLPTETREVITYIGTELPKETSKVVSEVVRVSGDMSKRLSEISDDIAGLEASIPNLVLGGIGTEVMEALSGWIDANIETMEEAEAIGKAG